MVERPAQHPLLPILQEILGSPQRVSVVCGPAASGKTTLALDLYDYYDGQAGGLNPPYKLADEHASPRALLLAPNRLTVEQLRRALLARRESAVLLSPQIMTFQSLATRVLLEAWVPQRPLSPVHRRLLLQGIIQELREKRRLAALAGVADTPGLSAAVDRCISELKRSAVEPERLQEAIGRGGEANAKKHRDLLAIYQRYQEYLTSRQLYDEEGQMWQARLELEKLEKLDRAPLPELRAVIVDGFTDFTPTQLEILRLLAGQVEHLVITLPYAEDNARKKLWHWTHKQYQQIARVFRDFQAIQLDGAGARPGKPLGQTPGEPLLDKLFDPAAAGANWPPDLHCVSAASLDSECRAIARWVKHHLQQGAAPHELAIVARNIEDYLPTLARVFAEAAIPVPAEQRMLAQMPLGRLLLALVRLSEQFDHAYLLQIISSSYFSPAALGDFDAELPSVAQLVVRHSNVLRGRESYARAFARLGQRVANQSEPAEDDEFASPSEQYLARLGPAVIERTGAMVESLLAQVDAFAAGGTLAELSAKCGQLARAFQLPYAACRCADDAIVSADLRSLSAIESLLEELAALTDAPQAARKLSGREFADLLETLLEQTPCPAARASGAVPAVGAIDARALRVRHLWLAGLNEGVFPAASGEQALISEADRARWARRGIALDARDDLVAREMLLFYLTLGRADETVTLSWLYSDSGGHSLERSSFLAAFLSPAGGIAKAGEHLALLPPAEFAPPVGRILSRREMLNTALRCAARPADSPELPKEMPALSAAMAVEPQAMRQLAWPLWALHRRWRSGPCDAFDGTLDDASLLAELARLVPAERTFSVSQLNSYLTCPWQYFAQRWLNLTPLEDPAETLLPRQRGLLVHAILRRMLAGLTARGPVMATDLASDSAIEALDAAIAAESNVAEQQGIPYPALWQAELKQVRQVLVEYLHRQASLPLPSRQVLHLELGFGMPSRGGAEPAAHSEPLRLEGPLGTVKIRGKIDRVDRLGDESGSLLIIDYKTGGIPKIAEDVQLPVYIKAAEQMLGSPGAGAMFQGIRLGEAKDALLARFSLRKGEAKENPKYAQQLSEAMQRVQSAVAGIAAGQFDAIPRHKCAGARCPYRRICAYSDSRAAFKSPGAPAQEPMDKGVE